MEDPQKRNNWKRVGILYNGNRRFRKAIWRKGKIQGQKTKSARRGIGENALSSLFSLSSSPVVRSIVVHSAVCRRRGSPPVPSPVFRLLIPPFQNVYQYAERLYPSRKGNSVSSFLYSRTPTTMQNDFPFAERHWNGTISLVSHARMSQNTATLIHT
jgi:hypothetical protein